MNWLRDNWMPIAAIALLAAYGWSSGAKDQQGHHPFIFTDAFTGKQYVVNPAGGIWPRMNDQGRHMTEWEQPR